MTNESRSLGELTALLRSRSDGLESLNNANGAFEVVNQSKIRIDNTYKRLVDGVHALNAVLLFLDLKTELDWSDVSAKLKKAKKWLSTEMVSGNVVALNDLNEALLVFSVTVESNLKSGWGLVLERIGTARALLEFIDNSDSRILRNNLGISDDRTLPSSMAGSIRTLEEAEEFIEKTGVGNITVKKFLEDASSRNGASLESMNDPDVKNWLDLENRREKFSITFRDMGI